MLYWFRRQVKRSNEEYVGKRVGHIVMMEGGRENDSISGGGRLARLIVKCEDLGGMGKEAPIT